MRCEKLRNGICGTGGNTRTVFDKEASKAIFLRYVRQSRMLIISLKVTVKSAACSRGNFRITPSVRETLASLMIFSSPARCWLRLLAGQVPLGDFQSALQFHAA